MPRPHPLNSQWTWVALELANDALIVSGFAPARRSRTGIYTFPLDNPKVVLWQEIYKGLSAADPRRFYYLHNVTGKSWPMGTDSSGRVQGLWSIFRAYIVQQYPGFVLTNVPGTMNEYTSDWVISNDGGYPSGALANDVQHTVDRLENALFNNQPHDQLAIVGQIMLKAMRVAKDDLGNFVSVGEDLLWQIRNTNNIKWKSASEARDDFCHRVRNFRPDAQAIGDLLWEEYVLYHGPTKGR